ncbi:MAG: glucosyl-3-phosphoglycerate synthase [Corynebacterium sp.]|uniref:glucosyl-3-phosphoglycerate synthase n=1 Tax=Corynebacterium sp. TaxID=1720 RepID=UPI0026DCECC5|nr:glucosyl-3-phosphoglycerate synthase [Corynebacterium sp.]MDO4762255.1 glucosyl-3-phosphoglycerate synthase [Corynebacterium sp.]
MKFTVIIPALNEEKTIAHVVDAARQSQATEIIVIDSDSLDNTATIAQQHGAHVYNWREILPHIPCQPGKGEALWRGVYAAQTEAIVFVDADVEKLSPESINALAQPLTNPAIDLVKAHYTRTYQGQATGGGRVTELCAKPLLKHLFPHLSHIHQPLAGEYAIRRSFALGAEFAPGYGVEVGLLIDAANPTQVPLPPRVHRNRPLHELADMADIVAATILSKAGIGTMNYRPPLNHIDTFFPPPSTPSCEKER